jgi:hypothetical protein
VTIVKNCSSLINAQPFLGNFSKVGRIGVQIAIWTPHHPNLLRRYVPGNSEEFEGSLGELAIL